MLLAGTETTSTLLSWVFHVLAQRPDIETRLHAEVDSVLGDGPLSFAQIGQLGTPGRSSPRRCGATRRRGC